jgi:uroporphyrinogen-III synthase
VTVAALPPLVGFTVAVVTHRRRHTLADLLGAAGARIVSVQGFRVVPQLDLTLVRPVSDECAAAPADELLVSSGFGFGAWLEAARGWGLADRLVSRFTDALLLARDASAADSLRAVGLREIWSTAAKSAEELLRYLLAQPAEGKRLVAQLDEPALAEACQLLRRCGLDVVEVPTYRVLPGNHPDGVRRLIDQAVKRQLDAVVFTDAAAVEQVLRQAKTLERVDALLAALRSGVVVACLGGLSAAPLVGQGVVPLLPALPFVEELVESVVEELPHHVVRVVAGGRQVEVRGHAVLVDGEVRALQPGPIDVLRALAEQPGQLLTCADIRQAVPGWAEVDDHAIEMAVSRLRRSLGGTDLVETVIKRGYRLAV